MIGRMIDKAALAVLLTSGLYLFFLNAGFGIPISCALTLVCAALMRYIYRRRPGARRITVARAEAGLMSVSMMGEEEARDALRTLTGLDDAVFLIRHPEDVLTLNALYTLWRGAGDGATVVVTCGVEDDAARFAKARKLTLIDRGALVRRIRQTGLFAGEEPTAPAVSQRLRRLWDGIRPRPRMIAYGLSLLGMYMATGQTLCLICALGVMGVAGAKVIERAV